MKRTEIEAKLSSVLGDARKLIAESPVQAFFVGIAIGIILTAFPRFFVPLILIFVIVAVLFWFFADEEEPGEKSE